MAGLFPACLTGASGRIMEIIVISLEDYSALVFAVWEAAVGMRGKLGCFSRQGNCREDCLEVEWTIGYMANHLQLGG